LVAALAELTSALRVVPFKLVGGEQESEMKFFLYVQRQFLRYVIADTIISVLE
jgi:hypothetical protein